MTDPKELIERAHSFALNPLGDESSETCEIVGELADALEAVTQWRDIESAPKDGSHIQLYRPDIQFVGYYGGANSGWRINAPDLPAMWPIPTHWMPLPPPLESDHD